MTASLAAALWASLAVGAAAGGNAEAAPEIRFEKYVLPNGLEVILHEDHSAPIVGVNLWYHVGSKNERPGRTGFAHLFEHMMFQGSKHFDKDYFLPLQQAGGRVNGSTTEDRTNYWETVPAQYLERALWMESDRMAFLLPAMSERKLANQRDVVKNERRQSYENRPYGLAFETILAALYPPEHPYNWPVIGSMADIAAATHGDVSDFFRRYYHPGNASLCIAGDFDPAEARRLVEKYFGPIPAGPKAARPAPAPATLAGDRRIQMTDRVGLSRMYMAWHSAPLFAPDEAALDVLADVLAGGKTSRLYRSLVRQKQIAQDVQAGQNSMELAGVFEVVLTARAGHKLSELQVAADAELQRVQAEPPTADEVARAVNRYESQLIRALEPISEFGGRADRLNMYNVFTGDPGYLAKDFARYRAVTPAEVQRVARKYLAAPRVILEVEPGAGQAIVPDPRQPAEQARQALAKTLAPEKPVAAASPPEEDAARTTLPGPGPQRALRLPPIRRSKLSNGLEVLLVERHQLPTVTMHLVLRAGRANDPAAAPGLAALTAAVWDEGTATRSAEEIADQLAGIGASLSISSGWDASSMRLFTLKRHLDKALEVCNDVLQNPSFPAEELDRQRNIALGRLLQARDEPMFLAAVATGATYFGAEHPYGRPQLGTPDAIRALKREDLLAFYRGRMRPQDAALVVVGDVTPAELDARLQKTLGTWSAVGSAPVADFPALPKPAETSIVLVDKPGAAQSVIMVAQRGAMRNSPDYFPLTVMNMVFGGQFSSRLNMNLREEKGYTYGARTQFDWRVRQKGPLVAAASVQTAVTAAAVGEFLKEFRGLAGQRPVTAEELKFAKDYVILGYPSGFETPGAVAHQLETLVEFDLSDDYFNTVIPSIAKVTAEDVARVGREYLDVDHLAIIIVGDRSQIEASLRKLPEGKNLNACRLDEEFRLVGE